MTTIKLPSFIKTFEETTDFIKRWKERRHYTTNFLTDFEKGYVKEFEEPFELDGYRFYYGYQNDLKFQDLVNEYSSIDPTILSVADEIKKRDFWGHHLFVFCPDASLFFDEHWTFKSFSNGRKIRATHKHFSKHHLFFKKIIPSLELDYALFSKKPNFFKTVFEAREEWVLENKKNGTWQEELEKIQNVRSVKITQKKMELARHCHIVKEIIETILTKLDKPNDVWKPEEKYDVKNDLGFNLSASTNQVQHVIAGLENLLTKNDYIDS